MVFKKYFFKFPGLRVLLYPRKKKKKKAMFSKDKEEKVNVLRYHS